MNIPVGTGIGSFLKFSYQPGIWSFFKLSYQPTLGIRVQGSFLAGVRQLCTGIENGMALV